MGGHDMPITDEAGEHRHAAFRVSGRSHEYVSSFWRGIGATIQGRHLFDLTNGWEAEPPAGEHLIVVSHRPKPKGWHPEADVPFVEDVVAAVEEAKQRARDRVVAVCAGNVGGQAFALGLVDEVAMDVVPVVFGKGKRYFGPTDSQQLLDDPSVVIQGRGFCTFDIASVAEDHHQAEPASCGCVSSPPVGRAPPTIRGWYPPGPIAALLARRPASLRLRSCGTRCRPGRRTRRPRRRRRGGSPRALSA